MLVLSSCFKFWEYISNGKVSFPHLFFPDASESLWVDGNCEISGDFGECVTNTMNMRGNGSCAVEALRDMTVSATVYSIMMFNLTIGDEEFVPLPPSASSDQWPTDVPMREGDMLVGGPAGLLLEKTYS